MGFMDGGYIYFVLGLFAAFVPALLVLAYLVLKVARKD